MTNIPEGYDENGVRNGYGNWYEDDEDLDAITDTCPQCGSTDVYRNNYGFLVCNNCGYEEVPVKEMGVCEMCGADTPKDLLVGGLCPACADEAGLI